MPAAETALLDEAVAWMVRTREPTFRDWEAFTAWLEADPAHNFAYEQALDADDVASALETHARPAREAVTGVTPIRAPRGPRRWTMALAAIAAGLVAIVGTSQVLPRHDRYEISTRPGQQRSVRLDDGTVIALNGDTRLTLDRRHPRRARLDAGEAAFSVVHNAANPFQVKAGGTIIQDVGTVFDVVRGDHANDVSVAEGSVVYDPAGSAIKLNAGRTLHDPDEGVIEIGDAAPATIGSWRFGRLTYQAAPLSEVASDLSRLLGAPVTVAPAIGARTFSGTIAVRGVDRARLFARLAALMDVRITPDGAGWRFSPGSGGAR